MTENFVILMSFLSFIFCYRQQEFRLISELNDYFGFDHNYFLVDVTVEIDLFLNQTDITPKTVVVVEGIGDFVSGLESTEISGKSSLMIVVIDSSKFDEDLPILYQLRAIQLKRWIQRNVKVAVFFPKFQSRVDVWNFFIWCKGKNEETDYPQYPITEVVAVTYFEDDQKPVIDRPFNVFNYSPFGIFNVKNVTTSSLINFFPSGKSNFKREQLILEEPFSIYPDQRLWEIVFDKMNATHGLSNSLYKFRGTHLQGQMHEAIELKALRMYPLLMTTRNLLVPETLPYSGFAAYIQNAMSRDVFTYTFITVAILMVVLILFRYIQRKKILLLQSITDVVNLLMNDNGCIIYQRLTRVEIFLILPLTFAGLVVVNGILSNLQSYIIQPVSPFQTETPEQVHNEQLTILVNNGWKDHVYTRLAYRSRFTDWSNRIFELDKEKVIERITAYNRSVAFIASPGDAKSFITAQKLLGLTGYHKTSIEFIPRLYNYFISYRFIFLERLNEIVHRIRDAGLFNYWMEKESEKLQILILNRNFYRSIEIRTDPNQFEFPTFIYYGWAAGLIVLILEIMWKKFRFYFKRIKHPIDLYHRTLTAQNRKAKYSPN